MRESLHFKSCAGQDQAERLAWLAEICPEVSQSTRNNLHPDEKGCRAGSRWLRLNGVDAEPIKQRRGGKGFHKNRFERNAQHWKALLPQPEDLFATTVWGMGYDKSTLVS